MEFARGSETQGAGARAAHQHEIPAYCNHVTAKLQVSSSCCVPSLVLRAGLAWSPLGPLRDAEGRRSHFADLRLTCPRSSWVSLSYFQVERLRPRELRGLSQRHTVAETARESKPGLQPPGPALCPAALPLGRRSHPSAPVSP